MKRLTKMEQSQAQTVKREPPPTQEASLLCESDDEEVAEPPSTQPQERVHRHRREEVVEPPPSQPQERAIRKRQATQEGDDEEGTQSKRKRRDEEHTQDESASQRRRRNKWVGTLQETTGRGEKGRCSAGRWATLPAKDGAWIRFWSLSKNKQKKKNIAACAFTHTEWSTTV